MIKQHGTILFLVTVSKKEEDIVTKKHRCVWRFFNEFGNFNTCEVFVLEKFIYFLPRLIERKKNVPKT